MNRWERALNRAVDQQVQIRLDQQYRSARGRVCYVGTAKSSTEPGRSYRVSTVVDERGVGVRCSCRSRQECKHAAAFLDEIGLWWSADSAQGEPLARII